MKASPAEVGALAWAAGAGLLEVGADGAGEVVEGDLLRAVHAARASGLHRLARAGSRVVRGVRDLRRKRPEFRLDRFTVDLVEWLDVAWALQRGATSERWIGTARRAYEPVGTLTLTGLLTEPVASSTGYAGVATLLADERGRVWSIGDVLPAAPDRALAVYRAAVGVGGLRVSHRRLCREGVVLEGATASADGRIGAGRGVRAQATAASSWDDLPMWAEPLDAQLARDDRQGLLFAEVRVAGGDASGLRARLPSGRDARLLAGSEHAELPWIDNLARLARGVGCRIRVIVRPVRGRETTAVLLAFGPAGDPADHAVRLPPAWTGRCNVGLDPLEAAWVPVGEPLAPEPAREALPDALGPLRARVERLAYAGRATLGAAVGRSVAREAEDLERMGLPEAAALLRALLAAEPDLPRAALAAALHERAARDALTRGAWA